ncbi:hypothetical protein WBQ88_16900 [Sphingopyxis sp. CCNWLW253]|uniref:hypothetical protein n=1 Tax=unclassified Sphingopyxis TaxID=2614943 RepID=UPI003012D156
MASEDRFKQAVVATLAKRAANICSNPDCQAITSGPSNEPSKAVNVGEAAHIYGANLGSARHDPDMASADRASITNAIWLCGNCHKLVDDDPNRYPAGLLFEWQRAHERHVSREIGKVGAALRRRYEVRHLEEFGKLSYLAERLILEKNAQWEYQLIGEVLRFEMAPVLQRWDALRRGLYVKPKTHISLREMGPWFANRMSEARKISAAFCQLTNHEFERAWGAPGVPGDDALIVATCRLFAEMCTSALIWEEQVRFVSTHEEFVPVVDLLPGVIGSVIDEAAKLPKFMAETFGSGTASGVHTLDLVLTLRDGWGDEVGAAMDRASTKIIAGVEAGEIVY